MNSQTTLDGLTALVTGASSGIGEATAEVLAAEGARVGLVARRADRLDELADRIRAADGTALAIPADITDQGQAIDAVSQTVDEFDRLDIVVNNAGVMLLGSAVNVSTEDWDRMIEINLRGSLYIAHAAMPHLLRAASEGPREVGDLVNVSSIAGRVVHGVAAVYSATKHGIGAFSEALRQEVTEKHVRIGLVEPGPVETELHTHLSEPMRKGAEERWGHVERLTAGDVAETIRYMVTRPRRVALNEVLVRPTESAF